MTSCRCRLVVWVIPSRDLAHQKLAAMRAADCATVGEFGSPIEARTPAWREAQSPLASPARWVDGLRCVPFSSLGVVEKGPVAWARRALAPRAYA